MSGHARVVSSVARVAVVLQCLMLVGPRLEAQDGGRPFARTRLEPGPSVTVGQPLIVEIEVLVPSFFSGAPNYPDVELRDALVLFVFRGVNFTERHDGVTWAGQRREYHVYPQRPGDFEIAEIPVGVRYRPLGGRSGDVATDTASPPPVRFEATLPPGAEGLNYFISALDVDLEATFAGRSDTLLVGEAFTRTITARVRGSLSMVIPPLSVETVPGLASYPSPAEVEDIEGFGVEAIEGRRTESVTYVPEAEGDYTIPGVELQWWDVTEGLLRNATLPPVQVHVAPNPDLQPEIPLPEDSVAVEASAGPPNSTSLAGLLRRWGGAAVALFFSLYFMLRIGRRFGPRLASAWSRAHVRRAESEAAYFRRFRVAARSNSPHATANALMMWLDRRTKHGSPPTLAGFVSEIGDDRLREAIAEMDGVLYGVEAGEGRWTGARLLHAATKARRRPSPREGRLGRRAVLPQLNPDGKYPRSS